MTKHDPSSTRLMNIPVYLSGQPSWLLIYTNDLEMTPVDGTALMIVPIPNMGNASNFGLVDVSNSNMKTLRKSIVKVCDALRTPLSFGRGAKMQDGYTNESTIAIHQIGNYDISVAQNHEMLMKNINWDHFVLPPDYNKRLATLKDHTLYPCNCAYVVAKARMPVKDDGFGVIYPRVGGIRYFPTAHEYQDKELTFERSTEPFMTSTSSNDGYSLGISPIDKNDKTVKYDVECYDFNSDSNIPWNKNDQVIYYDNDKHNPYGMGYINKLFLTLIEKTCTMSNNGQIITFFIEPITHIINQRIKGIYPNTNIFIKDTCKPSSSRSNTNNTKSSNDEACMIS